MHFDTRNRRQFVITEYREWDLFTVSIVTGERAGHRIIKKKRNATKAYLYISF